MEGKFMVRNFRKICYYPLRLSSFPEISENAAKFITGNFRMESTPGFLSSQRGFETNIEKLSMPENGSVHLSVI